MTPPPARHHLFDLVTTVDDTARLVTVKYADVRVYQLRATALVRVRRVRTTH